MHTIRRKRETERDERRVANETQYREKTRKGPQRRRDIERTDGRCVSGVSTASDALSWRVPETKWEE